MPAVWYYHSKTIDTPYYTTNDSTYYFANDKVLQKISLLVKSKSSLESDQKQA